MNTIKLNVEGMSCNHCKMSVEKALGGVAGVASAVVDLSAKSATVSYDPAKTDEKALAAKVVEAGYSVV